MHTLILTQIGNSIGLVLPEELLEAHKLKKGDTVLLTDTPESITITPQTTSVEEQLAIGREFMRDYQETFKELAK